MITNWAQQFVKVFQEYSEFKYPKLHSWIYYTTDLIRKYSSLNGFSTETYESLHKDFVKKPYYLTNKQNIKDQIIKMAIKPLKMASKCKKNGDWIVIAITR